MSNPETMKIDDVEYIRADSVPDAKPNGNRCVVVVDRGWIFAGDVTDSGGRVVLSRAVWVFRWESIGFQGVLDDPGNKKADIRKLKQRVDLPAGAEVFRIPVSDNWGL